MLRASADQTGTIVDTRSLDGSTTTGGPGGDAIVRFATALVRRTDDLVDARTALVDELGGAGAAAIAGVVGNFEMMNRLLDATGVPTPSTLDELRIELGLTGP